MGPPISVSLPYDAPLSGRLLATAAGDDPDHHADGDVHALLDVAGEGVADLGSVHLTDVSLAPQALSFSLTPAQLTAARAAGAKAHVARGTVHFVVSGVTDRTTGTMSPDDVDNSFVSLHVGLRTTRPTRVALVASEVSGGPEYLQGFVAFGVPPTWPRLTENDASPAAFGPIALEAGCDAYLLIQSVAVAARDPAAYVARVGDFGDTAASGGSNAHRWRLREAPFAAAYGSATAVGITRFAPHRYAGLRVDVRFDPTCPATSTHSRSLTTGLTRLVREMSLRVRIA